MSLFWRIFSMNAVVLVVAALLLLSPMVTVSSPVLLGEALVVLGGVVAMLVANAVLLRVGLAPLKRLSRAMAAADLLRPGARTAVAGHGEVAQLISTYNAMLDRLESERATSSARALSAQEAERRRVARELHDEVGQTLTAVLLQVKRVADRAPEPLREELSGVQETTRGSLDEIRRIARRLRPGVLEDLGLVSGLRALAGEFSESGLAVHDRFDSGLPRLDGEAELVVYRVAQEALTNTARHAGTGRAELALRCVRDGVELIVRDEGHGLRDAAEGSGIRGMRERALLLGGRLTVGADPSGAGTGTVVRLWIPAGRTTTRPSGPDATATSAAPAGAGLSAAHAAGLDGPDASTGTASAAVTGVGASPTAPAVPPTPYAPATPHPEGPA
ncbi:Signal transduction histidine-protein kinase/phosphatase DegS [Streptomyces sp. YIM 121038]|uniref:sensor histidine kinase n=1 Tax=Streptomyces sp. YIM 121038 TaxID=2136401 RepID=UPI0011102436|nr:histidine kinase [Streptomyces sp. YIM 121038]QCX76248.1 Signal transduction histidine-protein kinase/phosphatase DegS [Streptomyces sp. YIM 121038]